MQKNVRHGSCNSHLSTKHAAISNNYIMTDLNSQEEFDSHYDDFDYELLMCVRGWMCGGRWGRKNLNQIVNFCIIAYDSISPAA